MTAHFIAVAENVVNVAIESAVGHSWHEVLMAITSYGLEFITYYIIDSHNDALMSILGYRYAAVDRLSSRDRRWRNQKLSRFDSMPIPDHKIRLQTIVDRKLARKIEAMATRMGIGQSRMIYYLLDAAVQDEAWVARAIAGTFAKRVRTALRK